MTDTPQPLKCAHPTCECTVTAGQKYCSEYCKHAPEIELHCNCQHPECPHV